MEPCRKSRATAWENADDVEIDDDETDDVKISGAD